MSRIVAALFPRYEDAAQAVRRLEDAGVPFRDISIVTHHDDARHVVHMGTSDAATMGAGTGAGVGAALGAGAGLLAGLGLVAIPGLAPMVAAGWLAAVATGAAAGAAAGGLVGILAGAGLSDEDAEIYAEGVRRGSTLVIARVGDDRYAMARAILCGSLDEDLAPLHPLIESDRVEGTAVYDRNGKHIGSVKRLMIDKASGRVAYVMVSFTKFLGLEEETYAIPWDALKYDTELGGYRTDITEDQVRAAPAFSREATFERVDRARERELHAYYGSRYYWASLS